MSLVLYIKLLLYFGLPHLSILILWELYAVLLPLMLKLLFQNQYRHSSINNIPFNLATINLILLGLVPLKLVLIILNFIIKVHRHIFHSMRTLCWSFTFTLRYFIIILEYILHYNLKLWRLNSYSITSIFNEYISLSSTYLLHVDNIKNCWYWLG